MHRNTYIITASLKKTDFNFPNEPGKRQKSWESQSGSLQGSNAGRRAHVFLIKQIKNFTQISNKTLFTSVNKFQLWSLRAALIAVITS